MFQTKYLEFLKQKKKGFTQIFALICPWILPEYHKNFARIRYYKYAKIHSRQLLKSSNLNHSSFDGSYC